jgi:hypothetical protein
LISLIQHYFTKNIESRKTHDEAANAKLIMRLEIPNQFVMSLFTLLLLCGFSVLLNTLLFSPETILDAEQINSLEYFEKILFGFFYVLAHFLLVVFTARLIKGIPPLFLATEKGFCYNPAGISTGWILWDDITEVRETEIIYGRSNSTGPTLRPVLGIKFINPENYKNQAYSPLLKKLVDAGQKLNNFQTEGVGDVLLLPEDFGKNYGKVKSLFKDKTKADVFKETFLPPGSATRDPGLDK